MSGGGNHHEAEAEAEPEVAGKQSPGTMLSEQETSKGGPSQPADTERTSQQANNGSSHSSSPMPPSNGSRSHAAPIITNSVPNRPPSTTSMHSTGSAGPRSTTATSRRGGRTRSRSPPMMMNQRPPSTGPPAMEPYGGGGMEDRRAQPPSPANPSAAAAAAAAAAKSITRNPQPPPSSWYDSPDAREREYRRSRGVVESSRYHPSYYEGGPTASLPPRHHWPEDEAAAAAAAGGRPPSRNRYQPRTRPVPEDHYGYREAYSSYRGRGGRGEPYPPPPRPYEEEYERRYADPRYDDRRRQPGPTSPMPPGYDYRVRGQQQQQQQQHPPPPPRHHREDPYAEGARAEAGAPTMVKRTTRVIGTPTPIHMPRAPDTSSRNSRSGPQSNNSIFRGRPGSDGPKQQSRQAEGTAAAAAAAAAEKPLMSLRSHSNSFEEKSSKDDTKRSGDPLSPEAPPQIHHSHHQNAAESTLFFEPQRSPRNSATAGPPQPTSSIDMAPSFTLFNQSFDSIGDTANFFSVSGPLDSALQSTSFGVAPTGSEDKTTELHFTNSTGNFSQQILQGSTFEMSPSNSFGNGPGVMRSRSGNIVVLGGGQDNRAGSPSQLLDMYSRSYSGGGPVPGPSPRSTHQGGGPPFLEDTSHLRMSVVGAGGGSLAAPTLQPNAYGGRSFDAGPALHYRPTGFGHPEIVDGGPGFYLFLKRYKSAFRECSFLLPGLKAALLEAPDVKEEADETPKRHTNRNGGDPYGEPSPQEMAVALRRVASAVCAFGGTNLGERASGRTSSARSSAGGGGGKQSIFREKPGDAATVTPNSSAGTSPGSHRARQRAKYDEMLPSRYYENDNRLSWEFEEHPPIDEMGRDEEEADELKREEGTDKDDGKDGEGDKKDHDDDDDTDGGSGDGEKTGNGSKDGDQPKMRYRCKLCGQPKQNHTCPYQQSLARSIGVMIYPAVNAFTASEPGSLAPALSEMNNFISSGDSVSSMDGGSPSRPTPDRMRGRLIGVPPGTAQVTPESLRGNSRGASCTSPMTTPQRARTPVSSRRSTTRPGLDMQRRLMGGPPPSSPSSRGRKRGHSQLEDQGDLLFVEAVDLKPEQFRMVTASKIVSSPEAFTYPALPLPYAQRKRLSDNLFSLSKEVPQLTDECAAVLREAREKDMWDLAVAELMTQVVVVVHCHDGDSRFEGLRRYLMTLGISC